MPRWKRWTILIGGGLCLVGMIVTSRIGYASGQAAKVAVLVADSSLQGSDLRITGTHPTAGSARHARSVVCGVVTSRNDAPFAVEVSRRRSGFIYQAFPPALSWRGSTPEGQGLLRLCRDQARPL